MSSMRSPGRSDASGDIDLLLVNRVKLPARTGQQASHTGLVQPERDRDLAVAVSLRLQQEELAFAVGQALKRRPDPVARLRRDRLLVRPWPGVAECVAAPRFGQQPVAPAPGATIASEQVHR